MLVRPSFFLMGLNFHRLPQSVIQLDLKVLSPLKVSSEGGTVSAVARVADQQASSLGIADAHSRCWQLYPWHVCVEMCR